MPFVYLFRRDQVHKIGHSKDPHQRARQFGRRTEVVHLIETANPVQVEKALHVRFASQHIRGEWFDLAEEDVDLICQVARADAADDLPPALRATCIPTGRILVQASTGLAEYEARGVPAVGRQINFRAPDDLTARLDAVAEALALDVSSLVRMVLAEHLSKYEHRADEVRRNKDRAG